MYVIAKISVFSLTCSKYHDKSYATWANFFFNTMSHQLLYD